MKVSMFFIAMMTAAATSATAQGPSTRLPLESSVTLWFDGGSTMRNYKCTAKTVTANIETNAADIAAAPIDDLVTKASVSVPVATLECGNNTMNEHMRKALKATGNPEIRFVLTGYEVNGANAILNGTLTIAGKENPIVIPATVTTEAAGVRVKASKAIDMTQWGVKPPSLMMGTMKVKPGVTIGFDVLVKR